LCLCGNTIVWAVKRIWKNTSLGHIWKEYEKIPAYVIFEKNNLGPTSILKRIIWVLYEQSLCHIGKVQFGSDLKSTSKLLWQERKCVLYETSKLAFLYSNMGYILKKKFYIKKNHFGYV